MSDAITSTNLEQTGSNFGQPVLFVCMRICVLSPAHESEMRGYLVYVLIVKYLSHRLFFIQPPYIRLDGLIVDCFVDFLKHF